MGAVHGLSPALADAVETALAGLGDDVAVIGVEARHGDDLVRVEQEAWSEAIAAARAAFFALQRSARQLAERGGGAIVVLVPVHSVRPSAGCGLDAVVGSFLTTAAQVAAVELGERAVRVNVLAVGPLEGEAPPRTAAGVPLGRLTRPADVGAACRALLGADAGFVTGAVVTVDGGYAVTKAVGGSPFAER